MSREAMQQALEALEQFKDISDFTPASAVHAITALKQALAEPEQPVAIDPNDAARAWFTTQELNEWATKLAENIPKLVPRKPAQEYDYRTRYDQPCYKCSNFYCPGNCADPYAAPTPRKPLRDEEVDRVLERHAGGANWSDAEYRSAYALARAIEAAHGIKEQEHE